MKILASLLLASSASFASTVLYYNDGTADDFLNTFGDVGIGVPWSSFFDPGGFMDGTLDDIPPFNMIDNRGLVTLQGAAGGKAGGWFRNRITGIEENNGVLILTYGTVGRQKADRGSAWEARVKMIGGLLGVDPADAVMEWRKNGTVTNFAGTVQVKIVPYLGDPMVSIPPDDLLLSDLDPLDLKKVEEAAQNDNTLMIFWEVEGTRPLSTLDLIFGDFELNTGFTDLAHHFPYVAVLQGVKRSDFGDLANATVLTINGDGEPGSGPIGATIFAYAFDPVLVPEPTYGATSLVALAAGALLLSRRRMRAT
jgi:hypothetical protein